MRQKKARVGWDSLIIFFPLADHTPIMLSSQAFLLVLSKNVEVFDRATIVAFDEVWSKVL